MFEAVNGQHFNTAVSCEIVACTKCELLKGYHLQNRQKTDPVARIVISLSHANSCQNIDINFGM